jgi:hypothetical protein
MTDSTDKQTLSLAAYRLAEEIRDGRWRHVVELSRKPAPSCVELTDELQKRCPGFLLADYRRALADGLFETR